MKNRVFVQMHSFYKLKQKKGVSYFTINKAKVEKYLKDALQIFHQPTPLKSRFSFSFSI